MVSDGRIMNYRFNNTGSITTSGLSQSFETIYPLNGRLLAVRTDILNSNANGSILITHNGDTLYFKKAFTKEVVYPRKLITNNANGAKVGAGSEAYTESAMCDTVVVYGSGVGPGSTFFCELIYQRA